MHWADGFRHFPNPLFVELVFRAGRQSLLGTSPFELLALFARHFSNPHPLQILVRFRRFLALRERIRGLNSVRIEDVFLLEQLRSVSN